MDHPEPQRRHQGQHEHGRIAARQLRAVGVVAKDGVGPLGKAWWSLCRCSWNSIRLESR
jgi:hypothetical protein